MSHKKQKAVGSVPEQVPIHGQRLTVWPEGQELKALNEPVIRITDFTDTETYHDALISKILDMEKDPRQAQHIFKGGCGTKARRIDEWRFPSARLIHARAMHLCKQVLGDKSFFVDDAWANIYHNGDYCMPHSHLRSAASVVYFLSLGDEDPEHPMSGRFCIGDPRLRACCQMEEGRMTHSMAPDIRPGSMIIFPSQVVHFVNPYTGHTPRITLAWNVTLSALEGSAGDRWRTETGGSP